MFAGAGVMAHTCVIHFMATIFERTAIIIIFDRNFNGLISDPSANIYCINITKGFGVYNAWK